MDGNRIKKIAQKMHDTVGANIATIGMYHEAAFFNEAKMTKEEKSHIRKAKELINETSSLVRDLYADINDALEKK